MVADWKRTVRSAWILALVALIAQTSTQQTVSASDGAVSDDGAVSGDVDQAGSARALREWAGLDSSMSTIRESLLAGSAYTDRTYGAPLKPREKAVVDDIFNVQAQLVPVHEAAQGVEGYVSSYMERKQLVVLTSGEAPAMEQIIEPKIPRGGSLRVLPSLNTRAALEATRDEIMDTASELHGISSVGIDERTGSVLIGLDSLSSKAADALSDRYGTLVRLELQPPSALFACNSRHDCGTMGGLSASVYFGATETVKCTTGFITTWGSSSHRMLTAGHCIKDAGDVGSSNVWENPPRNTRWGTNTAKNFCNGCNTDSGLFSMGSSVPTDRDQYYLASGPRDLVGRYLDSALVVGRWVYRNGRTSGWGGGSITVPDVSIDVDPGAGVFWIHHSWKAGFQSTYGDSGAGMVTFNTGDDLFAAGVLFGGTLSSPWQTYFSTIQRITAYHGITLCTTNAC